MKIAYFDCFSGASGDMILGALVDAGLDVTQLKQALSRLNLTGFDLTAEKTTRGGLACTQASVHVQETDAPARNLGDILSIIESSDLSLLEKSGSSAIFRRLAEAEARVHHTSVDHIHFHEVGAMDAIVDIVGSVVGLNLLGIGQIISSPMNTGSGTVHCRHGILPVPAPATAELIREKPAYSSGIQAELLTPTGAAILTTLSEHFGNMPRMCVEKIGYGAGTRNLDTPNLLRLFVGEPSDRTGDHDTDQVVVIETNIDDMNPQCYEFVMEKAFAAGALDVWLTPIQMKKNRPAVQVSVISAPESFHKMADLLLKETTSIGLRWRYENRLKSIRHMDKIETDYGTIRVKIATANGQMVNVSPEYDDCRKAAVQFGVPLKTVMDAVRCKFCLTSEMHPVES